MRDDLRDLGKIALFTGLGLAIGLGLDLAIGLGFDFTPTKRLLRTQDGVVLYALPKLGGACEEAHVDAVVWRRCHGSAWRQKDGTGASEATQTRIARVWFAWVEEGIKNRQLDPWAVP